MYCFWSSWLFQMWVLISLIQMLLQSELENVQAKGHLVTSYFLALYWFYLILLNCE